MTPTPTESPRTRAGRSWWRTLVLVLVSLVGAVAASWFALAWLLMGLMGAPVEWWEPVGYPAGLVACVAVPVLVGRALRVGGAGWRWGVVCVTATGLVAGLLGVSLLGASA